MKVFRNPDKKEWPALLKRPLQDNKLIFPMVQEILNDIRNRGDEALFEYTQKFDKVSLKKLEIENDEIVTAADKINDELKKAIHLAAGNIEKFHSSQKSITQKI